MRQTEKYLAPLALLVVIALWTHYRASIVTHSEPAMWVESFASFAAGIEGASWKHIPRRSLRGLTVGNIHPGLSRIEAERLRPKSVRATFDETSLLWLYGSELKNDGEVLIMAGASREETWRALMGFHDYDLEVFMREPSVDFGMSELTVYFEKNLDTGRDELTGIELVDGFTINQKYSPNSLTTIQY